MLKYWKAQFFVLAISTVAYKCSLEKILESFLNSSFFGNGRRYPVIFIFIREKIFLGKAQYSFLITGKWELHIGVKEKYVTFGGGSFENNA